MTSCLALMTYWLTAHGCIFRRYYVKNLNSPGAVLGFMAAHSVCAVGATADLPSRYRDPLQLSEPRCDSPGLGPEAWRFGLRMLPPCNQS